MVLETFWRGSKGSGEVLDGFGGSPEVLEVLEGSELLQKGPWSNSGHSGEVLEGIQRGLWRFWRSSGGSGGLGMDPRGPRSGSRGSGGIGMTPEVSLEQFWNSWNHS